MASPLLLRIQSLFEDKGFKDLKSQLGQLDQTVKSFKGSFAGLGKTALFGFGIVKAFDFLDATIGKALNAVTNFAQGIIPAAANAETVFARLRSQMKLLGLDSESNLKRVQKFADETSRAGVNSSEAIQSALSIALRRNNDLSQAMRQVKIAQDIASVSGRDLTSVTQLLTFAQAGNTRVLRGLINVREADLRTAIKQGTLLDLLEKKFKGGALGEVRTYNGMIKQLTNSLGDLQKNLGEIFLPEQSLRVKGFLTAVRLADDVIIGLKDTVKEAKFGILVDSLIKVAEKFGLIKEEAEKANTAIQKTFPFEEALEKEKILFSTPKDKRKEQEAEFRRVDRLVQRIKASGGDLRSLSDEDRGLVSKYGYSKEAVDQSIRQGVEGRKERFEDQNKPLSERSAITGAEARFLAIQKAKQQERQTPTKYFDDLLSKGASIKDNLQSLFSKSPVKIPVSFDVNVAQIIAKINEAISGGLVGVGASGIKYQVNRVQEQEANKSIG